MKKHLIIGNPISHSLSPKIHNYWFKENNIDANYEKISLQKGEVKKIIQKIKNKEIYGMNVTVPFKQTVIPYLETQSEIVKKTNSVNTIFNKNGKIHGENTDVYGFEKSITQNNINISGKSVLIFGAGGVVSSINYALKNLNVKKIYISNRTLKKAKYLSSLIQKWYPNLSIKLSDDISKCEILINTSSLGLNKNDKISIEIKNASSKALIADIIMEPEITKLLREAEYLKHEIHLGKHMLDYQVDLMENILTKQI